MKQRPTGITILAILDFLGAAMAVVGSMVFLIYRGCQRNFQPGLDTGLSPTLGGKDPSCASLPSPDETS